MNDSKQELTWDDLASYPVWHFDPDAGVFRPLESLDEEIGSVDELHFRSIFTTPSGQQLLGSVTGDGDTAIGIFRNGRWYAGNKNWKQTTWEQLSQLVIDSPDLELNTAQDLLPLRFETSIKMEPFVDRSGVFDLT
jgi:hypothetical protein